MTGSYRDEDLFLWQPISLDLWNPAFVPIVPIAPQDGLPRSSLDWVISINAPRSCWRYISEPFLPFVHRPPWGERIVCMRPSACSSIGNIIQHFHLIFDRLQVRKPVVSSSLEFVEKRPIRKTPFLLRHNTWKRSAGQQIWV